MYLIRCLDPRTDLTMAAHGFSIELAPVWREMVAEASGTLNQQSVDRKLLNMAGRWLASCGYTGESHIDGKPLYDPGYHVRVTWGEWGPEHITVPGNACGLDLGNGFGTTIPKARVLEPHNIDCWRQKQLLLLVFCSFAEDVFLFGRKVLESYANARSSAGPAAG